MTTFNTKYEADKARGYLEQLIDLQTTIKIESIKGNRTLAQNRALHLFYSQLSTLLNDHGLLFRYTGLKGYDFEIDWSADMVKDFIWRPIMKHLYGYESTTEMKTNEVSQVFEIICRHFSEKGIETHFPSSFDKYLEGLKM